MEIVAESSTTVTEADKASPELPSPSALRCEFSNVQGQRGKLRKAKIIKQLQMEKKTLTFNIKQTFKAKTRSRNPRPWFFKPGQSVV